MQEITFPLAPAVIESLIKVGMLDESGMVPADILALMDLGDQPMLPEDTPHLWLDRGQSGKYVWRRDDLPIYVIRRGSGELKKGTATY